MPRYIVDYDSLAGRAEESFYENSMKDLYEKHFKGKAKTVYSVFTDATNEYNKLEGKQND